MPKKDINCEYYDSPRKAVNDEDIESIAHDCSHKQNQNYRHMCDINECPLKNER
jgi:hypothetical protein